MPTGTLRVAPGKMAPQMAPQLISALVPHHETPGQTVGAGRIELPAWRLKVCRSTTDLRPLSCSFYTGVTSKNDVRPNFALEPLPGKGRSVP